jgi:thymidylate kinase
MLTEPPAVALEGANGTGKTYLARSAAAALADRCHLLAELFDSPPDGLQGQVIAALRNGGGQFLRLGVPRTETLLLAALQVHRHEALPALSPGTVVLEDRGPLSVAVYQAAVLHPSDQDAALTTAVKILAQMAQWRPLPALTLLLTDEPRRRLHRFEHRIGRPASADEADLMTSVAGLYDLIAAQHPGEVTVMDRRVLDEDACVSAITEACLAAAASPPLTAGTGGSR